MTKLKQGVFQLEGDLKQLWSMAVMGVLLMAFSGCVPKAAELTFDASTSLQVAEPSLNASALYRPVQWRDLPGWRRDDHAEALEAFLRSCEAMQNDRRWQKVCQEAAQLPKADAVEARLFFESRFLPYEVISDGSRQKGLITGYFLPVLQGSRTPSTRFAYPIYRAPKDLVLVDLPAFSGDYRRPLRGRLTDGGRVLPYYSRTEIDGPNRPLAGSEIVWVDDPIGLFFLHIQGSGFVQLDSGETIQIAYAAQNGHSYRPIGRYLVNEGYLNLDEVSMQSIRAWLEANPKRMREVFDFNPSYVFFVEQPYGIGVSGSQGVPLLAKRSVAVDPGFIDLGTPVYVNTPHPEGFRPISRLTIAQDTGGAIRGAVRADLFWGTGDRAGHHAGLMRAQGRMWVLLPKLEETGRP